MRHLALLLVLVIPLRASADPKAEAKQHIDKAAEAHQTGDYATALTELNIAYTLDPKPELLYAIGQVHVKLGECAAAITFYERFLATHPKSQQADAANEAITVCKQQPPEPAPAKPPEPTKIETEPAPPRVAQVSTPGSQPPSPPPQQRDAGAFYKDTLGDLLVIGGVFAIAGGVYEYRSALNDLDLADASATYDQHSGFVADAQTKRMIAVALGAGGIALATAAVFRFRAHGRRDAVAVAPAHGGAMVTWTGSWR